MPNITFLTWTSFKANTSVALPTYFTKRASSQLLAVAAGINTTSGATHFYIPPNEEEILTSGLGSDLWFLGSVEVASIT